jgi:hypothetical protein
MFLDRLFAGIDEVSPMGRRRFDGGITAAGGVTGDTVLPGLAVRREEAEHILRVRAEER